LGRTSILLNGDKVDTLIGVAFYSGSANRYAICPRTDADFVAGQHIEYPAGWNLVSSGRVQFPAETGYNVTRLFPGAISSAWRFAGGYVSDTAIWPGTGYWLKIPAGKFFRRVGPAIHRDTIPVVNGWNLIGAIGDSIRASAVTTDPVGGTLSSFFGFNNGYNPSTKLYPTKGYWVKTDFDGYLILDSNMFAKQSPSFVDLNSFNSLTISTKEGGAQTLYFGVDEKGTINLNAYEMPPLTPAGMIDARYVSGRMLETYPADIAEAKHYGITVKNTDSPVTLKWNIVNGDDKQFMLSDANGKNSMTLNGSGEKTVKSPQAFTLTVMNGNDRPKEFAMSQNYPNPFNPTTNFRVSLPVASHLEVGVYNLLGQKVATLVNESRDAGYYTITWNSQNDAGMSVSSGVYFVKVIAGDFTSVKKVVLLK